MSQEIERSEEQKKKFLPFDLTKRNIAKICVIFLAIFAIYLAGKNFLERQERRREYLILISSLKKKGDIALNNKKYIRAEMFYKRALFFGRKLNLPKKYKRIISEINRIQSSNEYLGKLKRGYVFYNGKWVKKQELLDEFTRLEKLKVEIRNLIKDAVMAFARGNYKDSVKSYMEVLHRCEILQRKNGCQIDLPKLKDSLNRVIIYSNISTADNLLRSKKVFQAALLYEKTMRMMTKDIGLLNRKMLQELFRKTIETWIQAYKYKMEKNDLDNAEVALTKANNLLTEFPVLPQEESFKYKEELEKYFSSLRLLYVNKLVREVYRLARSAMYDEALDTANRIIAIINQNKTILPSDKAKIVRKITKLVIEIERQKINRVRELSRAMAESGNYESSIELLSNELANIENIKFLDKHTKGQLISLIQKEINIINRRQEVYTRAKQEVLERIRVALKKASKQAQKKEFNKAIYTLNNLLNKIKDIKFRNDPEIQAATAEIIKYVAELKRKSYVYRADQLFYYIENSLKQGNLALSARLCDKLIAHSGNNPWHDNKLEFYHKKVNFIKSILTNLRFYFSSAINRSAQDFLTPHDGQKIGITIDNVRIKKASIQNKTIINVHCLNLALRGLIDLYVQKHNKTTFYPLECKARIKVCENSSDPVFQNTHCKELRKKCSLCPPLLEFGK